MLDDVDVFAGHLAVTERVAGSLQLRVIDLARGGEHTVAFDEPAYSVHTSGNAEFETGDAALRLHLADDAGVDLRLRPGDARARAEEAPAGARLRPVAVRERAHHRRRRPTAPQVPISLVYRRDRKRAGPQPLLLYGYGSYGIPIDPSFSQTRVSLLDRGVVFAIAHIRGGGDLGRSWYEAGKMAKKQTTFDDFIACAEALIAAAGRRRRSSRSRAAAPAAC